jgi:hypothetical protein
VQADLLAARRKIEEDTVRAKEEATNNASSQGHNTSILREDPRGKPPHSVEKAKKKLSRGREPPAGQHQWNIRGFSRRGRQTLLKEYLQLHHIDIVILQKTIKHGFMDAELRSLEVGDKFFCSWLPANIQSGDMLLGVRYSMFEVGRMDMGQFFLSLSILHRASNGTM